MSARPTARWGRLLAYPMVVAAGLVLSGIECGAVSTPGGFERAVHLASALLQPDLSAETLWLGAKLSVETLAVAICGTALGAAVGFALSLLASGNIIHGGRYVGSTASSALIFGARTVLDVLRAVPDFAWALVVLVFLGAGPITGTIAIAISVTGLLGKTYSQLLDTVTEEAVAPLRTVAASRWVAAMWGYLPAARGSMLSYTLLRLECSVRNASVIGIVGGGGLGAALFEELGFGRYDRVSTLLGFLLVLTLLADRASKYILRTDAHGSRASSWRAAFGFGAVLLAAAVLLGPAAQQAAGELTRLDVRFLQNTARALLDVGSSSLTFAGLLRDSLVPVGIAIVATALAAVVAAGLLLVFPERAAPTTAPAWVQRAYSVARTALDAVALLSRAIPDVIWLLLFGVALGMGPLAAVAAIATHSFGLLARLFVEVLDDVHPRVREARRFGSARANLAWGIWPDISPRLRTHVWLQLEGNLRAGLVVGIVGAGGLGDAFADSLAFWRLGDAALQALAMVAITIAVDRIARAATRARHRP